MKRKTIGESEEKQLLWTKLLKEESLSSRKEAQLERRGNVEKPSDKGLDLQFPGLHQGLEGEVLQDGGEEEEQLHAGQALANTGPFPWKEETAPLVRSKCKYNK